MASVRINTEDLRAVTKLVLGFGELCDPAVPMLLIHWQGRVIDNKREASGQTRWDELAPAQWAVEISSWINTPERKIEDTALHVQGLFAVLDSNASSAPGCFVVGMSEDQLAVRLEKL